MRSLIHHLENNSQRPPFQANPFRQGNVQRDLQKAEVPTGKSRGKRGTGQDNAKST